MRWIRNGSLACFATIACVGVTNNAMGQQYYGRPAQPHCAPSHGNGNGHGHGNGHDHGHHGHSGYHSGYGSGYGYQAYRPIVVAPSYGYGMYNNYPRYSSGYGSYNGTGLNSSWGGYGMGGYPVGGSYGGGAFPRGGSYGGGGSGFSLYIGR